MAKLFEVAAERARLAEQKAAEEAAARQAKKAQPKPQPKPPSISGVSKSDPAWMRPNTSEWSKQQVNEYARQINRFKTLQGQLAGATGADAQRIRAQMDNIKYVSLNNVRNPAANRAEAQQITLQGKYLETLGNMQATQMEQYADIQAFNQQQIDLLTAAQNQQNTLLQQIQAEQAEAEAREKALADRADVQARFANADQQMFAQQVTRNNLDRVNFRRQLSGGQVARFSLFNAM